jgi:hypothetical protein
MRVIGVLLALGFIAAACAPPIPPTTTNAPVLLDQGPAWTDAARSSFYSQDQGS